MLEKWLGDGRECGYGEASQSGHERDRRAHQQTRDKRPSDDNRFRLHDYVHHVRLVFDDNEGMGIHDLIENKHATNDHPSDALLHVDRHCEDGDNAHHDDGAGLRECSDALLNEHQYVLAWSGHAYLNGYYNDDDANSF